MIYRCFVPFPDHILCLPEKQSGHETILNYTSTSYCMAYSVLYIYVLRLPSDSTCTTSVKK